MIASTIRECFVKADCKSDVEHDDDDNDESNFMADFREKWQHLKILGVV